MIVSKYDENKKLLHLNDYPIIGASLRIMGDGEEMYAKMQKLTETYRNHGMFIMQMGMESLLIIFRAEYMQKILGSSKHLDKNRGYEFIHPWLRFGLITSTGEKWAKRRKMLTPSFHYNILNDFIVIFNEQALIMCEKLEERIGQGEFNISPYITHCALDIICETAMGKHLNTQNDSSSQYVKALHHVCEITMQRQKSPWIWPNFLFYFFGDGHKFDRYLKILHGFTKNVIENRQKEYNENEAKAIEEEADDADESNFYMKKKRRAFLDMLLYNWHRGELTTEDMQEEVDTFMFAGHDTTSVGMMWALYMIVSHPEVYKKVNQEIEDVFGDSNRPASPEDLKKLDYLGMALKESMRIYPSVPLIGRKTTDDLEIDDYKIPPNQWVTLFIGSLHRDPQYFPDPLIYNPDRFLPENVKKRHAYSFIPFSAGRRNCIGQKFAIAEEKIILSWIFRRFRVETTQAETDIHPEMALVLRPKYGIKVKLTKRE